MLLTKIIFLFILAGLGLSQTVVYLYLKAKFRRWPVVAAKITQSRLLNQLGVDNENMLEALIRFEYEFRDKKYESSTPALRGYDLFPSYEYESSLVRRYQFGEFTNARVHPECPEVSYLEVAPLSRRSTILVPIMTITGIAIFIGLENGFLQELYQYLIMQLDIAIEGRRNA